MKKFLIQSILFLLPLILFFAFLEGNLRRIPNTYSTKRKMLEQKLPLIETAVLGSSHALYGINPDLFETETFNMAHVSQSLYYDSRILCQYLLRMPRLQTVVVNVSFLTLESNLMVSESWRRFFYRRFYHVNPLHGSLAWDLRNYSLLALYGPWNSLRYAKQRFAVNLSEDLSSKGWDKEYTKIARHQISEESGKLRLREHLKSMKAELLFENAALLEDLIRTLKSRGILVIFVTPPVSEYYSAFIPQDRYRAMQEVIQRLSRTYSIPYYNYMNDKQFLEEDFFDDDHLSGAGTEKFSRFVNTAVNQELKKK